MNIIDEKYAEYTAGEKKIGELHHRIAMQIGIPDSVMWTLYCLMEEDAIHTQNSIAAKMGVAKQTINSAVSWLMKQCYIYMEQLPMARNNKQILLTDTGKAFCKKYIAPLMKAEELAFGRLSTGEQEIYLSLGIKHNQFQMEEFETLLTELRGEAE
jgi:DNA-binding MarR family transcriptional regulator